MRMADFADDESSAGAAAQLSRVLLRHRVTSQLATINRTFPPGMAFDVEEFPQPKPMGAAPEPLDLVYGAGVMSIDYTYTGSGRRTSPVLLCDRRIYDSPAEPGSLEPIRSSQSLRDLFRGEEYEDTLIYVIPEPVPSFAIGEGVNGPGTFGTLGAVVTEKSGACRQLICTAGHVAGVGSTVTDTHAITGNVVWSHNPGATASVAPAADVALIEPITAGFGAALVAINGSSRSQPGSRVEVHGAITPHGTSQTMGFTSALFVPQMAGMWAQLYFTTTAASASGDSGAPVLAAGTNDIIGHVVGGAPGLTSFIQSIEAQLQATNAKL
jgi:hypothetical protein